MYSGASYREPAADRLAGQRRPLVLAGGRQPDAVGVGIVVAVTLAVAMLLLRGGLLIGQDSATQFYPWYDYLGERLLALDIPGWNPYQFCGAPFAADPQSGWTYLPAMLLFSAFPLGLAVPLFLVFHLLLAGIATYALARLLRIGVGGAVVAALAYELSGPVLGRAVCCPAALEVASWAPVALVGAELALRAHGDWGRRLAGWALAGLAVSQALAAWLGQGAYYFLLMVGAWVAWRTLLAPDARGRRFAGRVGDLLLHGGAIVGIGFGLAAAGILPRLEYVARSNVAGGEYSGEAAWASRIGGVTPSMIIDRMLDPNLHYPGLVTVLLAVGAFWLARERRALLFFFVFGLTALVLATPWHTPLHAFFYLVLPRFEALHQHWPERVSVVAFISVAILAGAAVDMLERGRPRPRVLRIVAGALAVAAVAVLLIDRGVHWLPLATVLVAAGLLAALAGTRERDLRLRQLAAPLLAALIALDLLRSFTGVIGSAPYGGFHRVDLDTYYSPRGAARFLEERQLEAPGRYIGFDPAERAVADGQTVLYRFQFADPETGALLVNNRGTLHDLEDAQGYNPVQPQRYVDYLTALNGHPQEYHDANVYPGGIDSPLLDLLNVRYIVVPADAALRPHLAPLALELPAIYGDARVQVLENADALPRAWIVHEARRVAPGEALGLLAGREVDPRTTALLEGPLPTLAPARDPAADTVSELSREPDRIRLRATTDAPGLLILSETWDPGWTATVDGEEVDVLLADHLLRAVPLPAGEHVVELRYRAPHQQLGLAISGVTLLALAGGALAVRRRGLVETANPAT